MLVVFIVIRPDAPSVSLNPLGPCGPGGSCVPVLLSLWSFLSLSSNLTCLQNRFTVKRDSLIFQEIFIVN